MAESEAAAALPDGDAGDASDGKITCPECGNEFKGIQGVIAHMRNKHQIGNEDAMAKLVAAGYTKPEGSSKAPRQRRKSVQAINKDALLRAVFPKGMPPSAEVVQATGKWLEEADRLSEYRY